MSICKHVLFKTLLRWYNKIVIESKTFFARVSQNIASGRKKISLKMVGIY